MAGLLISLLTFVLIIVIRTSGGLQELELTAYDLNLSLVSRNLETDPPVLLVAITESDIQEMGRWPITDKRLAEVIRQLSSYSPSAIGIDIYRDIPVPPGHKILTETLKKTQNVIAVEKFGNDDSIGILPPPALLKTDRTGFNDIPEDSGGIIRRSLLFLDKGGDVSYSFSLRLSLLYLQKFGIAPQPGEPDPHHIRLGDTTLVPFEANDGGYVGADEAGYQFLLDYKGGVSPFPVITLKDLQAGKVNKNQIQDKIIILGVDSESVKDRFHTPYSRGLDVATAVPGMVVHAHIISQLIRTALNGDRPIITISDNYESTWILFWCVLGGIIAIIIRSAWRFSVIVSLGLLVLGLSVHFSFVAGYWIPVVPPVIGWLTSASVTTAYISHYEKHQKSQLMHLFSTYVSREVADTIWQKRDYLLEDGRLQSQKLTATVFFTDLQGFTSLSEQWEPEALMDWLNDYMAVMARLIIQYDGVVDDYFGDAIKANFGVPFPRTREEDIQQDAINAVNCALAMEREMEKLNSVWLKQGLPNMRMRIGINTGSVVAGSLGTEQRMKYTTVGDTVNTAARLESLKREQFSKDRKSGVCRIYISEATFKYLDDQFETRVIDTFSLKGKSEEIKVYQVDAHKEQDHATINMEASL